MPKKSHTRDPVKASEQIVRAVKRRRPLLERRCRLDKMIALLDAEIDALTDVVRRVAPPKPKPTTKEPKSAVASHAFRKGTLAQRVVDLLDSDPMKIWTIRQVWDALDPQPKTEASLGSQLRLWVSQQRIRDVGRGRYRSAVSREVRDIREAITKLNVSVRTDESS